tara:strand:- start:4983 stop:5438 length:456 start_codon:yes stop_codon:yes gene_type:complete
MRKKTIISIAIFFLIFLGIFIHPERVIYEAEIIGKVLDEKGIPIQGAKVSRIEEKQTKHKDGYYEYEEYISETVLTDKNGQFTLEEKKRIEWIHYPFSLPYVWCYADFEVFKENYKIYRTEFNDYSEYNEKSIGCENITFSPTISLKKNNE